MMMLITNQRNGRPFFEAMVVVMMRTRIGMTTMIMMIIDTEEDGSQLMSLLDEWERRDKQSCSLAGNELW